MQQYTEEINHIVEDLTRNYRAVEHKDAVYGSVTLSEGFRQVVAENEVKVLDRCVLPLLVKKLGLDSTWGIGTCVNQDFNGLVLALWHNGD